MSLNPIGSRMELMAQGIAERIVTMVLEVIDMTAGTMTGSPAVRPIPGASTWHSTSPSPGCGTGTRCTASSPSRTGRQARLGACTRW